MACVLCQAALTCEGYAKRTHFCVLHHSMCLHRTRPFIRRTVGHAQKVTSCCIEDLSPLWITIRRTSSRLFRCVVFDCAKMLFPFSHLHTLFGAHCPMTGWVCQWKPFWIPVDDSFKKACVEQWVFQVSDFSDLSLSRGKGDVIPETPNLSLLSHRHHGDHRTTRTQLVLGNVMRHHHCSHDLHVNVWNYPSLVMLVCHQDLINFPCGEDELSRNLG